jgi:hypothetical protein
MVKSLSHKIPAKIPSAYLNIFKVLVVIGMAWLIYDKLWLTGRFDQIELRLTSRNLPLLFLCIGLSPINWLLETEKWRLLLSPIENLDFKKTSVSILSGITLGILTPGRIGEYGGRLMNVSAKNRPQAAFAHFIGSLAQNINIVFIGGLCAYGYFTKVYTINGYLTASILGFALMVTIALGLLYYRNDWISRIIFSNTFIVKIIGEITPIAYTKTILDKALFLSSTRHFIYMSQYVILLLLFDVKAELLQAYSAVGVIYLLQSSIVLPPALGLVVRSELAIIILKIFEENYTKLLSVPLILWTINLLVPAILGMFYIMKIKYKNRDE